MLDNTNSNPTLLGIATITRFIAQRLMDINLVFQWISTILASFAFFYNEKVAWIMVSLGFTSKLISFIINIYSQKYHSISREAQRLALLEDAYGKIIDTFQIVELRTKINHKIEAKAKQISFPQPYYSSKVKNGNMRLKQNIQQSTFWGKNLLSVYSNNIFIIFLTSVVLVIIFTYLLLMLRHEYNITFINPYLLTLGALTLILGMIDYFNTWFACKTSVNLLSEVDQRLEKIDIEKTDILLANFADYSIASVIAPPIPSRVHKKNRERLRELWKQRMTDQVIQQSPPLHEQSQSPEIRIPDYIIPSWISKSDFIHLLSSIAYELSKKSNHYQINKVVVSKIISYGNIPVFDIQLLTNNTVFRHLILRLHKDIKEAKKELQIIKRISDESIDLVSYIPLEEPFISQGALLYYHVDIQTHDQLSHIDEYVLGYLKNTQNDFSNYFHKMLSGFTNIATVYEKLSHNYSIKSLSDLCDEYLEILPPEYIIDLRKSFIKKDNDCVIITSDGSYPSITDTIISAPFNPTYTNWYTFDSDIYNTLEYNNGSIELAIKIFDHSVKIITEISQYNDLALYTNGKISFILVPSKSLHTLNVFLQKELNVDVNDFHPNELFTLLRNSQPRFGLHYAFRHKDLHCKNCLTSRSNFKIIDVADSGDAPICTDIARLEISLLVYLIKNLGLSDTDVVQILEQLEKSVEINSITKTNYSIAEVIKSLRKCFYQHFKVSPTDFDISISYLLEICFQISYSISSPIRIGKGIEPIISYWKEKTIKQMRS